MVYTSKENKDHRIVTEEIDMGDDGPDILICPQHRRTQGGLFLLALTVMLGSLICVLLHPIIGLNDGISNMPNTDDTATSVSYWMVLDYGTFTLASVLLCVGLHTDRPILMVPWAVEMAIFCLRLSCLMLKNTLTVFRTSKLPPTWSLITSAANLLRVAFGIYTIVCIVRYVNKLQLAKQGLDLQLSASSSKLLPVYLNGKRDKRATRV